MNSPSSIQDANRPNLLSKLLAPVDRLPTSALRTVARTAIVRNVVKFVGTAKLDILELTPTRAVVSVRNRRRVQNHIGGIHAVVTTLIAETATGFVVGMNVPDSHAPVIKSLKVEYKKRVKGDLRAVAELTPEQVEQIKRDDRGETRVNVRVTDETGNEPVLCELIWAWTPKRRD